MDRLAHEGKADALARIAFSSLKKWREQLEGPRNNHGKAARNTLRSTFPCMAEVLLQDNIFLSATAQIARFDKLVCLKAEGLAFPKTLFCKVKKGWLRVHRTGGHVALPCSLPLLHSEMLCLKLLIGCKLTWVISPGNCVCMCCIFLRTQQRHAQVVVAISHHAEPQPPHVPILRVACAWRECCCRSSVQTRVLQ